jgi:hypothetical protein
MMQPVATIMIDTEEDFDWDLPVEGTSQSTSYLSHVSELQTILAAHNIAPTYLVTYPVLQNPTIVSIFRRLNETGRCTLGLQLHPWVTPPFSGEAESRNSFSGNLAPDIEAEKLACQTAKFIECFGMKPRIFRAGRYGLSTHTAALLEKFEFDIDTSIAPRTSMIDEEGPDYSDYDCTPFWFGKHREILELPLCRSIVGWGGANKAALYHASNRLGLKGSRLAGLLAGSGLAERITLSPEGNDLNAMRRLVRSLLRRGQMILPLSFHSSSLWPGRNPYVRDRADLHWFYDRLSAILCALSDEFNCRFVSAPEIPALLRALRAGLEG